ncbi:MAG: helix-turn-helix transcriptional regulator [Phycisphaeraceae bacterium]|nr:helix-turn-helix transcriptional regulator [Phycisphaeraceae bacterium]
MARIRRRKVTLTDEQKQRHAEIRRQVDADKQRLSREAMEVKARMDAAFAAMQLLKAEREKRGISLTELAERTGIDKGNLSRMENNRNANPTLETLHRIARAIGGTIEFTFKPAA